MLEIGFEPQRMALHFTAEYENVWSKCDKFAFESANNNEKLQWPHKPVKTHLKA